MADVLRIEDYSDLPPWIKNQKEWTHPTLANLEIPGSVQLGGISQKQAIKDNKQPGKEGGGIILEGMIPPKFEFKTLIVTGSEYAALEQRLPIWQYLQQPDLRQAIPVYHPLLKPFGVVSCIIEEILSISPTADKPLEVVIKCIAVTAGIEKNVGKVAKKSVGPKTQTVTPKVNVTPPTPPAPSKKIENKLKFQLVPGPRREAT